MNHEAAIKFAEQRMREIGKAISEYHYAPVVIAATQEDIERGEIIIKGYNEFFFLINYENYTGFEIISDTGYFNADDYSNNTGQEFSGLIRIKILGAIPPTSQPHSISLIQQFITISEKSSVQIVRIKPIEFLRVTIH